MTVYVAFTFDKNENDYRILSVHKTKEGAKDRIENFCSRSLRYYPGSSFTLVDESGNDYGMVLSYDLID